MKERASEYKPAAQAIKMKRSFYAQQSERSASLATAFSTGSASLPEDPKK